MTQHYPRNTTHGEKEEVSIEDTRKRAPIVHLAGMMAQGQSDYIVGMEREGGRQMVESAEILPTEILWSTKEEFEALGFVFHGEVEGDPIFQRATLPKGWKREAGDNLYGYWTNLVDERGIKRASIFYKAAFYDRNAHMGLTRVGYGLVNDALYDSTVSIPWEVLTEAERTDVLFALDRSLDNVARHPDIYGKDEARTRALIASAPTSHNEV